MGTAAVVVGLGKSLETDCIIIILGYLNELHSVPSLTSVDFSKAIARNYNMSAICLLVHWSCFTIY